MTQKEKIKQLLSDGQYHHMRELNAICYRYSARLYDLEKDGFLWEKKQTRKGEFMYKAKPKQKPETNDSFMKWVEIQRKAKEQEEKQNNPQGMLF